MNNSGTSPDNSSLVESGRKPFYWTYLSFFYGFYFILTSPILLRKLHANDLWKALYSGRYLSIFWSFPHHGTFAFTPVLDHLPRNAFNWLGNLSFVGFYQLGGLYAHQGLRIILVLFVVLLLHAMLDFEVHPFLLLVFVFFTYALTQKTHLRTAIFAIPFTVLLMWIWCRTFYADHQKFLYLFPVLFVIWSSSHGSYIAGFGFFLVLVFGRILDTLWHPDLSFLRTGSRLILVTSLVFGSILFVSPFPDMKAVEQFGTVPQSAVSSAFEPFSTSSSQEVPSKDEPRMTHLIGTPDDATGNETTKKTKTSPTYEFLKSLLRLPFPERDGFRSAEFAFPFEHTSFLFVRVTFLFAFIGLASFVIAPRPIRFDLMLVSGAALIVGLGFLRTMAFIPLILFPVLIVRYRLGHFDSFLNETTKASLSLVSLLALWIMTGNVLFLLYSGQTPKLTGNPNHDIGPGTVDRFNPDTARWVLRNRREPRIYNTYNLGSYLIWKWWPYKKVFLDSKFTAFEKSFRKKLTEIPVDELLQEVNINHGIMETNDLWTLRYFLPSDEWSLAYQKRDILYFERQKPPPFRLKETQLKVP